MYGMQAWWMVVSVVVGGIYFGEVSPVLIQNQLQFHPSI